MAKSKKEKVVNETIQINDIENGETNQQHIIMNDFIDALNGIIIGINIAQSKGVYTIEEAGAIWNSIQTIHRIMQQ